MGIPFVPTAFSDEMIVSPGMGAGGLDGAAGLIGAIVVIGIVGTIGVAVYRFAKVASRGHDPVTLDLDLQMQALESKALAGDRSVEERLAELDRLHATGAITADERDAGRSRIIGSL